MSVPLLVLAAMVVVPVVVFGTVVVVALVRANRDDVPAVVEACNTVFGKFVDRLPGGSAARHCAEGRRRGGGT